MTDEPREYDKEFVTHAFRRSRRRVGIDVERGRVTRFVVQLEYLVEPRTGSWEPVVRLDHDAGGSEDVTHDVTEDGLHVDVYRDGEKFETRELMGPLSANEALNAAEEHLAAHLHVYIRRFERWHGIDP